MTENEPEKRYGDGVRMSDGKFADKRERPDTIAAEAQRVDTGYGKIYVHIGLDDDGDPFEVFVNAGDSGGFTNAWCEALGKTISDALRSGTDPEVVADDLMGIRTDRKGEDNGDTIHSIPDGVGVAMKRAITGKQAESVRGDGDGAE